jgi:glycosyltransferase involved in cell wall biosynthesis
VRFVVVTTGRRAPLSELLRRDLCAAHPGAEVRRLRCDPRLEHPVVAGDLLPQLLEPDGVRWGDLVMAFGARRAGWAVLPWLLADAGEGLGDVVVLDDTFEVMGPLEVIDPLGDALAARALHVDPQLGAWGGFAPGLLAIPARHSAWASWWRQRVSAVLRSSEPLSADPWWDLPQATRTIADPRCCLSARTAAEIEVGEGATEPVLVDFAGLDPRRPWWFAPPEGDPEVFLSDSAGVRALCRARAARLLAAGWTPAVDTEPPVLPGVPLTAEMRRWYRGRLAAAGGDGLPANPYVPGEVVEFLDELRGAGDPEGAGAGLHVDLVMRRREDLRNAFPHARWRDRGNFTRWLWSNGLHEGDTTLLTLPDPPRPSPTVEVREGPRPFGVNLVGYLGADLGLGVAARRLQRALEDAGVPQAQVSYDRTSSHVRQPSAGELHAPYHFNLMLITPEQLPLFVADVGQDFLAGHHNIGLWYWECDVLTPRQQVSFAFVQEVWAATRYLCETFEAAQRVPVRRIPPALVFDEPQVGPTDRERLGLDDRFTFLFSFDYLSVVERKNPAGLAEAYRRAIPDPDGGTRLVLKSINGHLFPEQRERLLDSVSDRADIDVWDALLPAQERLALMALADCYVSLHRAEGLGLTMAEAMAVGTPVIATGYSGNLDFMPEGSALLVPARIVEVGPDQYYPAHGHWAEPDVDEAAALMRRVVQDGGLRERLSREGRQALRPFSFEAAGTAAREALLASWRSPSAAPASSART